MIGWNAQKGCKKLGFFFDEVHQEESELSVDLIKNFDN